MEKSKFSLGRKSRPLDDWAIRFIGDIVDGAEKETFLYIDFRYGLKEKYRDIEMGINFRKQGKEGKVRTYVPQSLFFALCDHLLDICKQPEKYENDHVFYLVNYTMWLDGKKLESPIVDVVIAVGKDEEGPWLSLHKTDYPKVRCRPRPPLYWDLRDKSKSRISNDRVAYIMGRSMVTQWKSYINHVLTHQYLDDEDMDTAKQKKKDDAMGWGQKSGSSQSNWGQKTGQTSQSVSDGSTIYGEPVMEFDDDIPF